MDEITPFPAPPPLKPCECGRPRTNKYRRLCMSCTMYKYRYRLSSEQLKLARLNENKLCYVCEKLTRKTTLNFFGKKVCLGCYKILTFLLNPQRKAVIDLILGQPVAPVHYGNV